MGSLILSLPKLTIQSLKNVIGLRLVGIKFEVGVSFAVGVISVYMVNLVTG